MFRLRLLYFPGVCWLATPSRAATLLPLVQKMEPALEPPPDSVFWRETLAAIFTEQSFVVGIHTARASPVVSAVQLIMIVALAVVFARVLPSFRETMAISRYSATAFVAISRIRATIARRPFERCADKWSFSPSRSSSAPASTFKTSRTGNPL